MVTFVDNHDLARFHGVVNQKLEKFSQGILLLFTLRGIPSLYYGTEILMSATDGHGLIREDFPGGWPGDRVNKFDRRGRSPEENEAWDLIATLAEMRRNTPALYQGKLTHYVPKDGVYVYFRYDEHDCFLVAINTSSAKQVQPLAKFRQFIPEGIETQALLGTTYIQGDNLVLPPLGWGLLRVVR
jgi:glycosidase